MGVHWVNRQRTRDGFDLMRPDHLMFSPVAGENRLVGVAYALREESDYDPPDGFDGEVDQWHDHPFLVPGSETLHMLHDWFVDSPDGPFAGHNLWLSFHAAGVTPPPVERLADPAVAAQIRSLAAALAIASVDPREGVLRERFATPELNARLETHRHAILALVPQLQEASVRNDVVTWDRLAADGAREWRETRETILGGIRFPAARDLVAEALDRLVGLESATHRPGNH
jgi:hypothetical protein